MKNSAEKERWEDIAQAAVKKNSGRCKLECEKCDAKFTKIILSAIAESHQSKTEQPEPKIDLMFEIKEPSEHSTVETQNALLPCPFCGAVATLVQQTDTERPNVTWVACSDCNAMCDDVIGEPKEEAARLAVASWNKRAAPSGNDAGAVLLSKESEVAATIRARGIVNEGGMNPHVRMSVRERDSIVSELASLQRKLKEAELWSKTAWNAHQKIDSQRDVIGKMRKLLLEVHEWHRDEEAPEYNQCDRSLCCWCEQALALSSPVPTEAGTIKVKCPLCGDTGWIGSEPCDHEWVI